MWKRGWRAQPLPHLLVLVRRVVVGDHVHCEVLGSLPVNEAEELQPLAMTVSLRAHADHVPGRRVECGEQGRRAVALVVMRDGLGPSAAEGKRGLRAIERLDLGLLVAAQDDRVRRWAQVEPDDVLELLDEVGIAADLEGTEEVRLQPMSRPDPAHGGRAHTCDLRHVARAPVRRIRRILLRRDPNDLRNRCGIRHRRPTTTRRVLLDSCDALLGEPLPPKAHRLLLRLEFFGDLVVSLPGRSLQDDLGPKHHASWRASPSRELLQLPPLVGGQRDRDGYSHGVGLTR